MKTKLPESISSIQDAKSLLADLYNNNEIFHPEDNAHDIIFPDGQPTANECDQLNKLMDDISNLSGFDSCEFILELNGRY